MKSPSRRLRRLVGVGVAGLLAVGLAPIVGAGVAQAASTNAPKFLVADQTVIGTGQAGTAGGNVTIGASTDTFNAGDQITFQVAQPGQDTPATVAPTLAENANCDSATGATSGPGDRRYVSFAATPTAAGPTGGTLTLLPGVPSSSTASGTTTTVPGFCTTQDGATKQDIFVFTVATTGPGPITISNVRYDVGRGTGVAGNTGPTTLANSTTTGPVRMFMFFTNVSTGITTLTKMNSANGNNIQPTFNTDGTIATGADLDSNAWVTTILLTGPPKAFTPTSGGGTLTRTISGLTINEQVADAFGVAGENANTFCIDIASFNAQWAASPSLSVSGSGLSSDLVASIGIPGNGPGGTNTRITITIANNPTTSVLTNLTLNNVKLTIFSGAIGSVRVILTDCGDAAGPMGSLKGTNPTFNPSPLPPTVDANGGAMTGLGPNPNVSANTSFDTIGNFSGPNDLDYNNLNRVPVFFLLLADRSGGNDRVATARILQQEKFGLSGVNLAQCPGLIFNQQSCGGTRLALIATADNFPDALAASYAAGRFPFGAAILLARPTVDSLAQVQLALTNLGVKQAFILGGTAAVPTTVEDFLKTLNTSCTTDTACGGVPNNFVNGDPRVPPGTKLAVGRIFNPTDDTRYGTMRALNILTGLPASVPVNISNQALQPPLFNATKQVAPASPASTCPVACRSAFLVSGANFPDALSAGVRAFANGIPMILTDPAALSPEAFATMQDLQTQQVYIIGGTAAVSQAVQDQLTKATQDGGLGLVVARISGADRLATAVAVHNFSTQNPTSTSAAGLGLTNVTTVLLARGDTFPDSLTAAVQGVGPLFGIQSINGANTPIPVGLGGDVNKLNYGQIFFPFSGQASILLTVDPNNLGASTASALTTIGGSANGKSFLVNAIKCLGLQAAISDATCTAAQSALAGITT